MQLNNSNNEQPESQKRRDILKTTALLLGGATLTSGTVSMLMNSCAPAPSGEDWRPAFFTEKQIQLIADVADRIIPATDTPGARDALVHRVIDESVSKNMSREQQDQLVEGLEVFDQKSQELHNKDFVDGSVEEKDAVLQAFTDEAMASGGSGNGFGGQPNFYVQARSAIVGAYLSSEVAAKELLVYDPIPGEYSGCIDFTEVGGVYAL